MNLFGFVLNDPPNAVDYLGFVTVGFYGADTWWDFPNGGANPEMREIAQAVEAPIYRSLDIMDPYTYLLNYFRRQVPARNGYDEPIKLFGHSWGAISG